MSVLPRRKSVPVDEVAVHPARPDDVPGHVVEHREVALRREHDRYVGEVEAAVLERQSTATLTCGCDRRRSVTRVHRIGCISAMFEPQSTNASAASMSS